MLRFRGNIQHLSAKIIFCLILLTISNACNPTRRLKDGEYLLNKNIVVDRSASLFKLNPDVQKSDFEGYIKQKVNRKVLMVRFHLFLYNLINEEKARKKKEKRDARYDKENRKRLFEQQVDNEKRAKKGLPTRTASLKDKDKLTWREWVMDIGEPPVIYDSSLRVRSTQQIRMFLQNKGYFNNNVRDSVALKHKKATVYYFITPNKPYKVNQVTYSIKDSVLAGYILKDTLNSLIKKGNNYDADVLQKERDRMNKRLRNNGYYYFSKDYIFYKVDSSLNNNTVNINVTIRNQVKKLEDSDSTIELNHKQYFVNNIYIIADYDAKVKKASTDTIETFTYSILYTGKLKYTTKVLTDAMYIKGGDRYNADNVEQTYKRLSDIHAFKFINIQFVEGVGNYLDCYIQLTPILKQTFTVETEGTNTGGNLGVNGSFVYQNRNAFKGGEILEFRMRAGLEIQKLLTKTNDQTILNESPIPFNTIEFGPEATITIPRFVIPNWIHVSPQKQNPKTIFKAGYNYQQRPDYTRSTFLGSYGFNFKQSPVVKHFLFPVEINLVNFTGKADFENYLQSSNDPLLVYRFTNHITNDFRYIFNFNNQSVGKKNNFSYFKFGAESSGNGLRGVYNIMDQFVQKMPKDVNGGYTLDGITYSQYVRTDFDWRYYRNFNLHDRLVFRLAAGVGKPLNNLRELPLEKSFFGGGPSGIRAWKARTLGPGSFSDPNQTSFDKVGDNQIETNLEYRFNVTKIVNGAAFVDAGNVWLRKKDPDRPGGEFKPSLETLGEFAIGAGLGLRLDFSFFVIRFDAAIPIKDPAYAKGDRWTFTHQPFTRTNLNFGIGYPF